MGAGAMKSGGGNGGSRRRRRLDAPMAEINVTPFVDVMLVLLIIFMVAAPLMTAGVPVDLPESKATSLPQPSAEPTVVSIDAAGELFLGEEAVSLDGLPAALAAAAASGSDERIYLRADGAVPYARVNEVMGELYSGGFRNIAFVSRSRQQAEPR